MAKLRYGKTALWQNCVMAKLRYGKTALWQNCADPFSPQTSKTLSPPQPTTFILAGQIFSCRLLCFPSPTAYTTPSLKSQ
jgi:hypothetical protein